MTVGCGRSRSLKLDTGHWQKPPSSMILISHRRAVQAIAQRRDAGKRLQDCLGEGVDGLVPAVEMASVRFEEAVTGMIAECSRSEVDQDQAA